MSARAPSPWVRVRRFAERLWDRPPLQRALVLSGLGLGGLVLLGVLLFAALYVAVDLPAEPQLAHTSVVLDADGNPIAELYEEQNRVPVRLDQVADVMQEATVAAEDRSFYSHTGVDPIAITRAFWNDVRGRALQGGSTITQQLVKNTYLSPERTVVRKAKEAVLAVKVEQEMSKREILERYLNTVYFGRGAWGVEMAARNYFGVHASELTAPQAALLAGLIRSPEMAEPASSPDEARARRDYVLRGMATIGAITSEEAEQMSRAPLGVIEPPSQESPIARAGSAAYFVDQVRQWALQRYGERLVFGGGLRIRTTLNSRMQQAAEHAVASTLGAPDDPEAAVVSIDDQGAVRAMIGGRDFKASKVNLALGANGGGTGRQAGSTFKPFVLAAAVESGIPIRQTFAAPAEIELDTAMGPWKVTNFGERDHGQIDVAEATVQSVNTVYAQLITEVGPESVARIANSLGIESQLEPVPSLALGTSPVSPLEMARAFMTFGNRGTKVTPYYVDTVTDADGSVIYRHRPDREDVMARQHADVVNWTLQNAVEHGTGRAARFGRPLAGKTGTTQDFGDAWFAGYTPKISTVVWMGYPEGQARAMTNVHGRSVTGGSFPAQIFQQYMGEATAGVDLGVFEQPPEDLLTAPTSAPPPPPDSSSSSSSTSSSSSSSTSSSTTSSSSSTSSTTSTTARGSSTTTTTSPSTTTTAQSSDASTTTTTAPP